MQNFYTDAFPEYRCPTCGCHLSWPENADVANSSIYHRVFWCCLCGRKDIGEKAALDGRFYNKMIYIDDNYNKCAFDLEGRRKRWDKLLSMSLEDRVIKEAVWGNWQAKKKARRFVMGAYDFTLVDEGTMDTCIRCDTCGYEMRYSFECASEYRDSAGMLNFGRFIKEVVIPDHVESGECYDGD